MNKKKDVIDFFLSLRKVAVAVSVDVPIWILTRVPFFSPSGLSVC